LMRRIDELHLKWPFYGSRRMVFELNQAGHGINRKRVHLFRLTAETFARRGRQLRRPWRSRNVGHDITLMARNPERHNCPP
jgi:hypothetical protein